MEKYGIKIYNSHDIHDLMDHYPHRKLFQQLSFCLLSFSMFDILTTVLSRLAFMIGAIKLLTILKTVFMSCKRNCWRRKKRLFVRYGGRDTWALVTGGSDGIGAEFCKQLALEGFNICIMSRTVSKMEKVAAQLKTYGVETMMVQADFSGSNQMQFYKDLQQKVSDIDIGLLVLNAGCGSPAKFAQQSHQDLAQMLDTNICHVTLLLKVLLPRLFVRGRGLMRREKMRKSGIIVVSSLSSCILLPKATIYGASKACVRALFSALNSEMHYYRKRVEVLTLIPGLVDTNMTGFIKNKSSIFFAPVEKCVETSLRDLGYEAESYGAINHEIQGFILSKLFKWIGAITGTDRQTENLSKIAEC